MKEIPPRPTLAHAQTAIALQPLLKWFLAKGGNGQMLTAEFEKLIWAVYQAYGTDAYRMAKQVETEWKWPADTDLVNLFHTGLEGGAHRLLQMTHDWVTSNGIRVLQRPRDHVRFFGEGDAIKHGVVVNVLAPTATVLVALIDKLEDRKRSTPLVAIPFEDLILEEIDAAV